MRLLLDQGIPFDAAALLRQLGHESWHVAEVGMQISSDEEILQKAMELDCVVITLDADFHALVAVSGLQRPSVIRLRREGCKAETVVDLAARVIERFSAQLAGGCLISVKENRVSCHTLPIGNKE